MFASRRAGTRLFLNHFLDQLHKMRRLVARSAQIGGLFLRLPFLAIFIDGDPFEALVKEPLNSINDVKIS